MRGGIVVVFAASVIALVLSGCKGVPKTPPAEPAQKKVVEEPKKLTPQEEEALAQEKLLKEAKAKFDRLCAKVDLLISRKEFSEAIETLRSFPEEFAQTEFKQEIEAKIAQIEKLKKEEEERAFNEEAQSLAKKLVAESDALLAQERFDEALDLLKSYPEKYAQTPSQKLVEEKTEEVRNEAELESLKKAWEEHQQFLLEAQEEFKKLTERAETFAAKNQFESALQVLRQYPEKFAQTEWKEKLQQIEADILKRKDAYEQEQRFLKEAKETAEKAISSARALSQEKKFDEALSILANYPQKFADTESAQEIAREIETVKSQKAAYEEEQKFLAAAEKECRDRIYEAKKFMEQNRYDDALKVLSEYPTEYSETGWASNARTFSRLVVQHEKERYEAHQKFLRDAKASCESTLKEAESLIAANRFEEAISVLNKFPGEYEALYGEQVKAKLKEALDKKEEESQRRRIMLLVGAVVLSVVVVLALIVLVVKRSPATEE